MKWFETAHTEPERPTTHTPPAPPPPPQPVPAPPDPATMETIRAVDAAIRREESRLLGLALFFECLCFFHAPEDGLIETERKQFRNLIQSGRLQVDEAFSLLDQIKTGALPIAAIEPFTFTYLDSHPKPEALATRADALVSAYNSAFPDRPMTEPFSPPELYHLLKTASLSCARAGSIQTAQGQPCQTTDRRP